MAIYQLHPRSQKGADPPSIALSDSTHESTHESDDDPTPELSAVLLQGKNESSSAKPYKSYFLS